MVQFPKNFIWGAATAAYQVEGGNSNSDWWPWEKKAGKESSGDACRHYEMYEKDFDLAKSLHHNAHRLSVEWSRIEPEEGKFSQKELQHYVEVLLALKARNIEPIVTLHHFTNPIWFSESGGWTDERSVKRFERYCNEVTRVLAKHVRYWITINEPMIYMTHSYVLGWWPPQLHSIRAAIRVQRNMEKAHIGAYRIIHRNYRELSLPRPAVSISQHVQAFIPCKSNLKNKIAVFLRHQWFNLGFVNAVMRHGALDFLGINYYSRQLVDVKKWTVRSVVADVFDGCYDSAKKNSLGWDIYPEGLYEMLLKLKKYNLPIMITENGICTSEDSQRWEFLKGHLEYIHRAIEKGVNVTGYLYWSLLDNFEWAHGYGPRFGLINMDYKTHQRTVRESAKKFAEVCRTGTV